MPKNLPSFSALLLLLFLFSCSEDGDNDMDDMDDPDDDDDVTLSLVNAFPNLTFQNPIFITGSGDGSGTLYVAQQTGQIYAFENDSETSESSLFLDISDRLTARFEQGLLGLAFHPDFAANGRFFVNYTDEDGTTTVSGFRYDGAGTADPSTEEIFLTLEQPFANHNAGMIAFGPDGFLYIATGDGGSGGDPLNNSQDRTTLHGNILRIDIDQGGSTYGIPGNNPFVSNSDGFREEIYAYGLRNPWRFSFDSQTGDLWLADVGQDEIEEVNLIVSGGNYGWKIMEGENCFEASSCDQDDLILPVAQYDHDLGASVTGGYVYRGTAMPDLVGRYFYGDFISGRIWSLDTDNPTSEPQQHFESSFNISSFGTDDEGNLYLLNYGEGTVFTLTRSGS